MVSSQCPEMLNVAKASPSVEDEDPMLRRTAVADLSPSGIVTSTVFMYGSHAGGLDRHTWSAPTPVPRGRRYTEFTSRKPDRKPLGRRVIQRAEEGSVPEERGDGMRLWDVLVTTRDEAGNRVSDLVGTFAPDALGDAVEEACRRADQCGGGVQVVRHIDKPVQRSLLSPIQVA